jgi:hypothetical protein
MILVNAQYNVARPKSLSNKIGGHQRRKMFQCFANSMKVGALDTILDFGVTTDRGFDDSNYLEAWYPHKSRITAVDVDNAEFLSHCFRVSGSCRRMGGICRSGAVLLTSSIRVRFSSMSVVGNSRPGFLREAWRVARKGVFITSPIAVFRSSLPTNLVLIARKPSDVAT